MKDIVKGYLKAVTSFGGQNYDEFKEWFTEQGLKSTLNWMRKQPKFSGTLYCGYTFDPMYFDWLFVVGGKAYKDHFTQLDFPSFTTDEIRAVRYIKDYGEIELEDCVKVLFEVHTKGKCFVDISEYSYYKEEHEFKVLPSIKCKVVSFERKCGYYKITLEEL